MYIRLILLLSILVSTYAVREYARVYNGLTARIEDYPYQVLTLVGGEKWCGGSILTSRIVITAAHCLLETEEYTVQYGSNHVNHGKTVKVERLVRHENYDIEYFLNNDIGLIFVAEDIEFGPTAKPIPLASKLPATGATAIATGWGRPSMKGPLSEILQKVEVKIVDQSVCRGIFVNEITDSMLCAGVSGRGICKGDSGGPLVVNNELVGVVSWIPLCNPKLPAIYANIVNLRHWIDKNIKSI